MTAAPGPQQPDEVRWWACPNTPPCPHGAVLHDSDDAYEGPFTCCAEDCPCGRTAAPSAQPDEAQEVCGREGCGDPLREHRNSVLVESCEVSDCTCPMFIRSCAQGHSWSGRRPCPVCLTPAQPVRDTEEGRR